ncbi:Protein kinase, putative [Hondaea fermentalgiana]|uniref:Protein kinase, putative n=1 Tax=Hondaea fermentalgiana TaxID=2315210 RepID=A0A2R5G5H4_9STRA|nr:Protein kinase, putative [Hondaea fermentalgiana]|eukprot:GBG25599.1 Protein kinase, putative [Hondaea fermentalgiana]
MINSTEVPVGRCVCRPTPITLPTDAPTSKPTSAAPTPEPTISMAPTTRPTPFPSMAPTPEPTRQRFPGVILRNVKVDFMTMVEFLADFETPTSKPTFSPTPNPTPEPTLDPTAKPTARPTTATPTFKPTSQPTFQPTSLPTSSSETVGPTIASSLQPTTSPSEVATEVSRAPSVDSARRVGSAFPLETDLEKAAIIDMIPFEIYIRCFFARILGTRVENGETFDVGISLSNDTMLLDFMPMLEYDFTCMTELDTSGTRECSVDVGMRDFSKEAFTSEPTVFPTFTPTVAPTLAPTNASLAPTSGPGVTGAPSDTEPSPTYAPTLQPTSSPTLAPTLVPTAIPTASPLSTNSTTNFTLAPSSAPTSNETIVPTVAPSGTSSGPAPAPAPTSPPSNNDYSLQLVLEDLFAAQSSVEGYDLDIFYSLFYTGHWNMSSSNIVNEPSYILVDDADDVTVVYSADPEDDERLSWTIGECPMLTTEAYRAALAAARDNDETSAGERAGIAIGSIVGEYESSMPKVRDMFKDLEIDGTQLTLGTIIGHGANGRIFRGTYCGSEVAVKELFPEYTAGGPELDLEAPDGDAAWDPRNQIWREVRNLRLLRHPNVIQLYGCSQTKSDDSSEWRFLVIMELGACSLRDLLNDEVAPGYLPFTLSDFDYSRKLVFMREVCAGLAYIHACQLIHFDIKPENILINRVGQAKICDLGIAKLYAGPNKTINMTLSTMGGTPPYMAPELLRGVMDEVGVAVDVYAFGMVLWQVFHPDETPHPQLWSVAKLFHEVMICGYRPDIDEHVPEGVVDIITRCWDADSRNRPALSSLLAEFERLIGPVAQSTSSPRRSRYMSNEDIGVLQVGEKALIWEHAQRRFVPCIVEALVTDQDLEVLRYTVLMDEKEYMRGEEAREQVVVEYIGPDEGDDDDEENSLDADAHKDQTGDFEDEGADQAPQSGAPSHGDGETDPFPLWVLRREDVPQSFCRSIDPDTPYDWVSRFQSLSRLAAMHFRQVLQYNDAVFRTTANTMAQAAANPRLAGPDLSLDFEDELKVSAEQKNWLETSFVAYKDGSDRKGSSVAVAPASTSSTPKSTSEAGEVDMFENDRMTVVKFADLIKLGPFIRYHRCSAALHLPTFVLVAVKEVPVGNLDTAQIAVEQILSQWRSLCGLCQPEFAPGALSHGEARIAAREFSACPELANLYGCYFDTSEQTVSLLVEYMDGGSLQDVLLSEHTPPYDDDADGGDGLAPLRDSFRSTQDLNEHGTLSSGVDVTAETSEPVESSLDGGAHARHKREASQQFEEVDELVAHFGGQPDMMVGPCALCDERILLTIARRVMRALEFLHEQGCIHGEVKPSNVLLSMRGGIKLGGYAMNGAWRDHEDVEGVTSVTLAYASPEQLQGIPTTSATDVWGLMMTLLTAALGRHPFWYMVRNGRSRDAIVPDLLKAFSKYSPLHLPEETPFPAPSMFPYPYEASCQFSAEFSDFISQGLRFEPEDRPTIDELLRHPWMRRDIPVPPSLAETERTLLDSEERFVDEILEEVIRRLLQRVSVNLESRQFLQRHPKASETRLVLRSASIARLASQMGKADEDVKNSFIYVASEAEIRTRRAVDTSGGTELEMWLQNQAREVAASPPQELPPRPISLTQDSRQQPPLLDVPQDQLPPKELPPKSWKVRKYEASFTFRSADGEDENDANSDFKASLAEAQSEAREVSEDAIFDQEKADESEEDTAGVEAEAEAEASDVGAHGSLSRDSSILGLPLPPPLPPPPSSNSRAASASLEDVNPPSLPPKPEFLKSPSSRSSGSASPSFQPGRDQE